MTSHEQRPLGQANISPLVVSDRLISLAQQCDSAGFRGVASHLVELACAVFDDPAPSMKPPSGYGRSASQRVRSANSGVRWDAPLKPPVTRKPISGGFGTPGCSTA